jgi:hypothetical protein
MTNQTKLYIGLGVIAVAGYFVVSKQLKKPSFMNLTQKLKSYMVTCTDGTTFVLIPNSDYGADCTNHGGKIKSIRAI